MQELCALLGRRLRLAGGRGAAQRVPAVPHRARRARHPLPPRPLARTRRAAARPHPRLARLGRRVPQGDRPARPTRSRTAATRPTRSTSCARRCPGYGFSDKPDRAGWKSRRASRGAWAELMARLGYDRYGAQGGDWGASVTTSIGAAGRRARRRHPPQHAVVAFPDASMSEPTAPRSRRRSTSLGALPDGGSPATRPSSRPGRRPSATGWSTRPPAQAAWIVEKFWAWTDCDGHPENVLTRDELLDNVMLYWLPAHRRVVGPPLLGELQRQHDRSPGRRCPSGCSIVPEGDLPRRRGAGPSPASPTSATGTSSTAGGHFAAFEQPETFVDEVRSFFRLVR